MTAIKRVEDEEAQHSKEIYCAYLPRCSTLLPWLETEENDTERDLSNISHFSDARARALLTRGSKLLVEICAITNCVKVSRDYSVNSNRSVNPS